MHQSTFPRLRYALLTVALVSSVAARGAGAQSATAPTAASAASAVVLGASGETVASAPGTESGRSASAAGGNESRSMLLDRRAAGLTRAHASDRNEAAPLPRQENGNTRTNTALMLVGAAAVILGAAVGDEAGTVLIIGGAGIGFFGLYRLLN